MSDSNNFSESDLRNKLENNPELKLSFTGILDFLPNSEYDLILYMSKKGIWCGTLPPPPEKYSAVDGAIEFGLFLYWFHNVNLLNLSMFGKKEKDIKDLISWITPHLQDTQFNSENYSKLEQSDLIYEDGTVLNMETYATFDQRWFIAFLNLLKTMIHDTWYREGEFHIPFEKRKFPTATPAVIPLVGKKPNTVNIAIVGDWGAGNDNAKAVMNMVTAQKPDYIIHVGDTYYGGTPLASDLHGEIYFAPGEEMENLVDLWPPGYEGHSFTLNSNHEMYSGANGLFYDAYGAKQSPVGSNTPFSAHQGASCFALTFGGWTLLGLDTAFEAKILKAFMVGSLGEADGTQTKWIKSLQLDPKKTIVFTHHNGFEDSTKSGSPLWGQLQKALGEDPFAWYWGHIHNGIVYKKPITIPTTKDVPGFETHTYARCLGHGSLPYGIASSLVEKNIEYQTDTLKPNSNELYNGFAMISLTTKNGVMESISESFFDVSGKAPQPPYSKRLL